MYVLCLLFTFYILENTKLNDSYVTNLSIVRTSLFKYVLYLCCVFDLCICIVSLICMLDVLRYQYVVLWVLFVFM